MNIFNKKRIHSLEILSLGVFYCPLFYTLFVLLSLLIGLFTPLIIQLQTYFIDYAAGHSNIIIAVLAPSVIAYFILNFIDFNSQNLLSYWNFKISSNLEKRVMAD